jgi:mRNA-degrading endonuclease RelE of RelBE toxin-antitoxin system
MDKVSKSLKKLHAKERERVKAILEQLETGNTTGLDLQKLSGQKDIYRVRKGDLRVIYLQNKKGVFILAIERRSEKTYKKF